MLLFVQKHTYFNFYREPESTLIHSDNQSLCFGHFQYIWTEQEVVQADAYM